VRRIGSQVNVDDGKHTRRGSSTTVTDTLCSIGTTTTDTAVAISAMAILADTAITTTSWRITANTNTTITTTNTTCTACVTVHGNLLCQWLRSQVVEQNTKCPWAMHLTPRDKSECLASPKGGHADSLTVGSTWDVLRPLVSVLARQQNAIIPVLAQPGRKIAVVHLDLNLLKARHVGLGRREFALHLWWWWALWW
jgi:hypothetical protein